VTDPVNGAYLTAFPCLNVNAVPTFTYQSSFYNFTLPNANWLDTITVNSVFYCIPKIIGGLTNVPGGIILGDPFITSFYI